MSRARDFSINSGATAKLDLTPLNFFNSHVRKVKVHNSGSCFVCIKLRSTFIKHFLPERNKFRNSKPTISNAPYAFVRNVGRLAGVRDGSGLFCSACRHCICVLLISPVFSPSPTPYLSHT